MRAAVQAVDLRLRPGERREPIVVTLDEPDLSLFVSECRAASAAPEAVYPLLLERRLLLDDLAEIGVEPALAVALLTAAAQVVRATVPLDGASSDYLRSFLAQRQVCGALCQFLAPVPVRVYARAIDLQEGVVEIKAIKQALSWEQASAASARTMAEWGFLVLLGEALTAE
jgi:hypothetical protein